MTSSGKLYLLFGVHNHQPVGNFGSVFDNAYEISYKPFAGLMAKHPKIKWSMHCSGILWEFLKNKHPEYISSIKKMAQSGQLELLTGGYFEPILPVIPERDREEQIKELTEFIEKEFNVAPQGAWVAERVWDQQLARIFSKLGVKYTILDDYHFLLSGIESSQANGYYITEEEGFTLKVFPINEKLRQYVPFRLVEDSINYFREITGNGCDCAVTVMDDGEKFGMWPKTHKHVYEDGWLERFFNAIEANADWIKPVTFSEFLDISPAKGRVYLPETSYFEMAQWAMSQDTQKELKKLKNMFNSNVLVEQVKKFVRGASWKNFLIKYPESNNMHKKMLYVSEKAEKLNAKKAPKAKLKNIKDLLYAGQCNCAYWHGVFGGLYLPHLRRAIYEKLISCESMCGLQEDSRKAKGMLEYDFNKDGKNELIFENRNQNIYFEPNYGGGIFEWDIVNPVCVNLINTLARREESYHSNLLEFIETNTYEQSESIMGNIKEFVASQGKNISQQLNYDWYRKISLLDHFIHPNTKYDDFRKCKYGEQGDFVIGNYTYKTFAGDSVSLKRDGAVWVDNDRFNIGVEKTVKALPEYGIDISYSIKNNNSSKVSLLFGSEFNFGFSVKKNEDEFNGLADKWERADEIQKVRVSVNFKNKTNIWVFPVETVSISEGGLEKTYQGTTVFPLWNMDFAPYEKKDLKITVNIGII